MTNPIRFCQFLGGGQPQPCQSEKDGRAARKSAPVTIAGRQPKVDVRQPSARGYPVGKGGNAASPSFALFLTAAMAR
jgi:hypothetical protein